MRRYGQRFRSPYNFWSKSCGRVCNTTPPHGRTRVTRKLCLCKFVQHNKTLRRCKFHLSRVTGWEDMENHIVPYKIFGARGMVGCVIWLHLTGEPEWPENCALASFYNTIRHFDAASFIFLALLDKEIWPTISYPIQFLEKEFGESLKYDSTSRANQIDRKIVPLQVCTTQ